MVKIKNVSRQTLSFRSGDAVKDIAPGETADINTSPDNAHVAAKLHAGLIEVPGTKAAALKAHAEKPAT